MAGNIATIIMVLLSVIALVLMGISYYLIQSIRTTELPMLLKKREQEIEKLSANQEGLKNRYSLFKGESSPLYRDHVKTLNEKIDQADNQLSQVRSQIIQIRYSQPSNNTAWEALLSAFSLTWRDLLDQANRTNKIVQDIDITQKKIDGVLKTLEKDIPEKQWSRSKDAKINHDHIMEEIDPITKAYPNSKLSAELTQYVKRMKDNLPHIPVSLISKDASETKRQAIKSDEAVKELNALIDFAQQVIDKFKRGKNQLDEAMREMNKANTQLINFLERPENHIVPIEEYFQKYAVLKDAVNELNTRFREFDPDTLIELSNQVIDVKDKLKANLKEAGDQVNQRKQYDEKWGQSAQLLFGLKEFFNTSKDLIEWQDSQTRLGSLEGQFQSLHNLLFQEKPSIVASELERLEFILDDLVKLETQCHSLKEQAEHSLKVWKELQTIFAGDTYQTLKKTQEKVKEFHPRNWDETLKIGQFEKELASIQSEFNRILSNSPIKEKEIPTLFVQINKAQRDIQKLQETAQGIQKQYETLIQESTIYSKRLIKVSDTLTGLNSSTIKDQQILSEIQKFENLAKSFNPRNDKISDRFNELEKWEIQFSELLGKLVKSEMDTLKLRKEKLEQLLKKLSGFSKNINDSGIFEATTNLKNMGSRYISSKTTDIQKLIEIHTMALKQTLDLGVNIKIVENAISEIAPLYGEYIRLNKDIEKSFDNLNLSTDTALQKAASNCESLRKYIEEEHRKTNSDPTTIYGLKNSYSDIIIPKQKELLTSLSRLHQPKEKTASPGNPSSKPMDNKPGEIEKIKIAGNPGHVVIIQGNVTDTNIVLGDGNNINKKTDK